MNNTDGIKLVFGNKEALTILACSLDTTKPSVMQQAVQVLAAVSLIPPLGHESVLEAITMTGEIKGFERFQQVVQGLSVWVGPHHLQCRAWEAHRPLQCLVWVHHHHLLDLACQRLLNLMCYPMD
jgi:hypothetical protein